MGQQCPAATISQLELTQSSSQLPSEASKYISPEKLTHVSGDPRVLVTQPGCVIKMP